MAKGQTAVHTPPTSHILVVDDEPEIAESLSDFLAKQGEYSVTMAGDGPEAIRFLDSTIGTHTEIDLVLLDMRMPGMSGLEVLEWIRGNSELQYTRVVLLTAAASNQDKVEALSAGADDYITKPYYPQELLARVQTILRTQQLEKQLHRQSQQLAALNRIGQQVVTLLEPHEVLQTAVQSIDTLLGVELAAAWMIEGGLLRCQHVYGRNGQWQPANIPPGQGLIGTMFAEATAVFLDNPLADGRFQPGLDAPPHTDIYAILITPFVVRRRPVGIFAAYNKQNGRFNEIDLDLMTSLARSISEAIENAWLFQGIRRRQQELLEHRNTLQALIDGILLSIYTISEDWHLVSVNKNKADELEMHPSDLVNKICYRVFYNRQSPCDHCQVATTLSTKEEQSWSVRSIGEDHLPSEWDVHAYPIPSTKIGSARAVIVWQDRTEERRLESSLLQAGKLAAIGQLAAGVAHEINNPLTAVNANAEILKLVIPPSDENYESVDLIYRAGERAAQVVQGLLNFARQEEYAFVPSQLNKSITEALSLVKYQIDQANVQVIQNLADDLPRVTASWEHLKSVWLNLLVNARDATQNRPGERHIEITTRLGADSKHVQVLFRDNGKGMSQAELKHIFEPFYTTKDPGKGTGLGLATSHRIIEQHKGEINVVSAPNEGTTFIVRLPINTNDT
ncbi:MAG: response regulator [Ardenticatenaceae bacterium]|nr:response regulator [Ardenticatenaceae bacterium]